MRVLLTGAAGFLGSACRKILQLRGHQVLTTDRRGAVDLRGDLADPDFTAGLPDVETVVHAAAVQYVSPDLPLVRRQRYFERNNVVATRCLCARYGGRKVHFVNVGTSMMYRQCGAASYAPGSPMQGQGVYSNSKLAAQKAVESSFDEWSTIVPCIIGGPGREGLFRRFVRMIQRSGSVAFPGRGETPLHMVHVDDVAALAELVAARRARGLFNAGAPEPLSIMRWIDEIAAELGVAGVRVRRFPLRPVHFLSALTGYRLLAREQLLMLAQPHVLDISGSLALGWIPQWNNARIVRDIARYIVSSPAQGKAGDA
jgi:nucleoside-diphosphate-sugar epimerase